MMMLIPIGRSVRLRVLATRFVISSGGIPLTPSTPNPPALDTAAASSGPAAVPMPAEKMGNRMPSSTQSGVRRLRGTSCTQELTNRFVVVGEARARESHDQVMSSCGAVGSEPLAGRLQCSSVAGLQSRHDLARYAVIRLD